MGQILSLWKIYFPFEYIPAVNLTVKCLTVDTSRCNTFQKTAPHTKGRVVVVGGRRGVGWDEIIVWH